MADLSRYLPLSRRPDVDESGVTADRRAETAEVLTALAAVVRACDEPAWVAPTARTGWRVVDVASELVAGFDRTRIRRALDAAGRIARGGEARRLAELARLPGPAEGGAAIVARADVIRDRPKPTSIVELDDAVVAALLIGDAVGVAVPISARASGAVALRRAAAAPTEIRAVISGHRLRATDAGWEFGHGAPLVDTAAGMLRFLTGIGDVAPHAPRDDETPGPPRA